MESKRGVHKPTGMTMNFSRAMAIMKSQCPHKWVRAHAKALPITRDRYGLPGVYVQVMAILREVKDWDDSYGAVKFLRVWVGKHREEAEHVA